MKILAGTIGTAKGGNATDTNSGDGGAGIASDGTLTIHSGNIETAQGGTSANGNGGSGIRSGDTLTISNSTTITNATGGTSTNGNGGSGIYSNRELKIDGNAAITNATGGDSTDGNGGYGIRSSNMLTISDNAAITNATGGNATSIDGTGGSGIFSDGKLSIEKATITNATGGDADSGTGGSGIRGDGSSDDFKLYIYSTTIENATGGSGRGAAAASLARPWNPYQHHQKSHRRQVHRREILPYWRRWHQQLRRARPSRAARECRLTGGNADSGTGGSFVNVAGGTINTTGGSGKSGGAGVSTESGIVSIGNSDTPLDLTATAPDADNAIRGRDGKKLDEIIHLEENGKRGLVKLVENGVTRLFHNGVYTKSIYPAGSETHPLGDWVITKKPTCTEKGERQRNCKVEHCVVTETEELPALGHQWSGWMPVQGDSSREYRSCAVCGAVEYRDVSHNSGISDSTISTGLRVLDPAPDRHPPERPAGPAEPDQRCSLHRCHP